MTNSAETTQNTDRPAGGFPALYDPRYPVHKSAALLEPYLEAIVDRIRPEKIILFGSQAYGEPTRDSDYDLLVVRKGIHSAKDSNIEIRQAIWNVLAPPQSFTFLSTTPEEYDSRVADGDFVYRDIAERGVLLYAA